MSSQLPNDGSKDYEILCTLLPVTDFDMGGSLPRDKQTALAAGGFVGAARDDLVRSWECMKSEVAHLRRELDNVQLDKQKTDVALAGVNLAAKRFQDDIVQLKSRLPESVRSATDDCIASLKMLTDAISIAINSMGADAPPEHKRLSAAAADLAASIQRLDRCLERTQ